MHRTTGSANRKSEQRDDQPNSRERVSSSHREKSHAQRDETPHLITTAACLVPAATAARPPHRHQREHSDSSSVEKKTPGKGLKGGEAPMSVHPHRGARFLFFSWGACPAPCRWRCPSALRLANGRVRRCLVLFLPYLGSKGWPRLMTSLARRGWRAVCDPRRGVR